MVDAVLPDDAMAPDRPTIAGTLAVGARQQYG